jgi:hypothetical protein
VQNVKFEITGGGANTKSNHVAETGKEILNNDFRIFYVDFNLRFTDYTLCDFSNEIDLPMNCNCENIHDGGCVASCDDITTPFVATSEQTRIETDFNGSIVRFTLETEIDESVVIPSGLLNEDYTYNLRAFSLGEGMTQLTFTVEPSGTEYDCLKIQVKP